MADQPKDRAQELAVGINRAIRYAMDKGRISEIDSLVASVIHQRESELRKESEQRKATDPLHVTIGSFLLEHENRSPDGKCECGICLIAKSQQDDRRKALQGKE